MKIGDVISSPVFEHLIMCRDEYFNEVLDKKDLRLHKKTKRFLVNPPREYEKGRLESESKYAAKINKNTKFVVININDEDGGSGGGVYEERYSSVLTFTAKALTKDGRWNDKGILIQFCEDRTDINHSVKKKDIKIHGKMKMKFV